MSRHHDHVGREFGGGLHRYLGGVADAGRDRVFCPALQTFIGYILQLLERSFFFGAVDLAVDRDFGGNDHYRDDVQQVKRAVVVLRDLAGDIEGHQGVFVEIHRTENISKWVHHR